jgi:hypothetical protein
LTSEKGDKPRPSLLETLDELIFHMNDARAVLMIMIIASLIMAPIAIGVAAFFAAHPGFLLRLLLLRDAPLLGIVFLLYLILTVVLSALWLYVGLREYSFLSRWNQRFKQYMSLKERVDRDLEG